MIRTDQLSKIQLYADHKITVHDYKYFLENVYSYKVYESLWNTSLWNRKMSHLISSDPCLVLNRILT